MAQNYLKNGIRAAKKKFYEGRFAETIRDQKRTWKTVNNIIKNKSEINGDHIGAIKTTDSNTITN